MENKISLKRTALVFAAGAVSILILLLIASFAPSRSAIVKTQSGEFFRANRFVFAGGYVIMTRSYPSHDSKKELIARNDIDYSLSAIGLEDISFIEYIDDEGDEEAASVPPQYLGNYHINVSAHRGTLSLWEKNGRIYGAVKFPNWAHGAVEYLKNVTIKGNSLYFKRSVSTPAELRKTGAGAYFVQHYNGKYSAGGKIIKGSYSKTGHRGVWEAKKF